MGQPAAKQGDQVVATDTHIVMIPSPGGPVPTPLPHPFVGQLDGSLSSDVNIEGKPAAVREAPLPTRRRTYRKVGRSRSRPATRERCSSAATPCSSTASPRPAMGTRS